MIKYLALVLLSLLLVSCGLLYTGESYIEEFPDRTDIILLKLDAEISSFVCHKYESVSFQFTTSINYPSQDTTYFIMLSLISRFQNYVLIDSPIQFKTREKWENYYSNHSDDSSLFHRPIYRTHNIDFEFGGSPERDPYFEYFLNKVTYEIDRKFLDDLYNLKFCQFSILMTEGEMAGSIDIKKNQEFINYYERYLK